VGSHATSHSRHPSQSFGSEALTGRRRWSAKFRVSTPGQDETGISLDIQRDAIRAFADHLGTAVIEIFEDVASARGSKSSPSRLDLQRALEAVRDHDGILVVWDWSRLSRHADDLAEITTLLPSDDRIISVKGVNAVADATKAGQLLHA